MHTEKQATGEFSRGQPDPVPVARQHMLPASVCYRAAVPEEAPAENSPAVANSRFDHEHRAAATANQAVLPDRHAAEESSRWLRPDGGGLLPVQ